MKMRGHIQSQGDHNLFIKNSSIGKVIALILYVDDIIVISDYIEEMMALQTYLAKEFKIKDLGKLR